MNCAVLLAAGSARRFGGPHKLLATIPHRGATTPLVRVAAERLREEISGELIVVLGCDAERIRLALDGVPARFVLNEDYAEGMSGSLRAGARAADDIEGVEGILVALGDQPLVPEGVVRTLAELFHRLPEPTRSRSIVVPRYEGADGHPVLFGRAVVPELLTITGDRGGRAVVERDRGRVHHVDFSFPPPLDVDTPEDLRRLVASATPAR